MSEKPDPLADLMQERRPIEDALQVWMDKWAALSKDRGFDGDPFAVLKPIEEVVLARRVPA